MLLSAAREVSLACKNNDACLLSDEQSAATERCRCIQACRKGDNIPMRGIEGDLLFLSETCGYVSGGVKIVFGANGLGNVPPGVLLRQEAVPAVPKTGDVQPDGP